MGLFRRSRAPKHAAAALDRAATAAPLAVPEPGRSEPWVDDESDVFVCKRDVPTTTPPPAEVDAAVTLIVTGWYNVEPGPLSWVFPSMRAALDAVRKMKNAVEWAIVLGGGYESIEDARARGKVLIDQRA